MRTLFSVEVRRLLSRRFVRILLALSVLGILIASVIVFFQSADVSRAEVVADNAFWQEELGRCQRGEFGPIIGPDGNEFEPTPEDCIEFLGIPDPRFRLVTLETILAGTSVPLIILAVVIGATSIGAEWQKDTLTTMLTWEPRRLRLIIVKMLACAVVTAFLYFVLQLLLGLALWPSAVWRGTTEGVDAAWFVSVGGVLSRGAAVTVFAAVIAFSIATVGRNTSAALGVAALYITVIEGLVRGLRPRLINWLVADNAAVFITGEEISMPFLDRTVVESGLLLLIYTLILAVIAMVFFKARDVT
jgi:ABC-type transport system involved in multi-copper enzyme maturation permease subunit